MREFFEGLHSQKIKTLKTSKLKTRKIKSLMEEGKKYMRVIFVGYGFNYLMH